MPKQLNTIVKTVLLSIVTTTAMAQQNPFAVLQQIQKAVEQVQGNAGSASPEKTVQPTIPAGTIATGKQGSSDAGSLKQTTSTTDFCRRVETNPTLQRYMDLLKKATAAGMNLNSLGGREREVLFGLDPENLVRDWIRERLPLQGDQYWSYYAVINQCAYEMMSKDIRNSHKFFNGVRHASAQLHLVSAHARIASAYAPIKTRGMDSDGNIVEKTTQGASINWNMSIYDDRNNMFKEATSSKVHPLAAALLFNGGDKVLANANMEYLANAESFIQKVADENTASQLAREKSKKADSEAQLLAVENKKKRFEEYKNGNFKSTKSCFDIIEFMSTQSQVQMGLQPLVKPSNGYVFEVAKLEKFQENGTSGNGYINTKGKYGVIKSTKNTIWLDKGNIAINANVCVLGKYVDNTNVPLTSGSSQQAAVLDLICIQSESTCLSESLK